MTNTLTPEQATTIVRNGGLVVTPLGDIWWHNGKKMVYTDIEGSADEVAVNCTPHSSSPPEIFGLTFPLTLPGPEAKTLLQRAPVGMLEAAYHPASGNILQWAYCETTDLFISMGWNFEDKGLFVVRLRPGWLESQRARFARGEFGEATTKETAMEENETLTAGQALDALIAGDSCTDNEGHTVHPKHIDVVLLKDLVYRAPFTRVPAKPTSKTITLDNGLTVTVFADRVEADVPGCGLWVSTKRKYEVAMKLEGMTGEVVAGFAFKAGNKTYHDAHVHEDGIHIEGKTITFIDIRRVIAAMDEVAG